MHFIIIYKCFNQISSRIFYNKFKSILFYFMDFLMLNLELFNVTHLLNQYLFIY